MAKIGLLIIATKKYFEFVQPLITSADEFFLKNHEVVYYVFTDKLENRLGSLVSNRKIEYIETEHKEWPWMTLGRYELFSKHKEKLKSNDYLYYIDADMLIVDTVGDEILGNLVATQHPGYYNRRGTPETRPESTAYVAPFEEMQYFAGGFNGGTAMMYLCMAENNAHWINYDFSRGIIAIWHDESHLNRYLIDNPPDKILSPSYCYGENMIIPFSPKIIALNKNHKEYRNE
jgi:histo-blood group ABO system transferase